jgi:hypothetical protein
VPQVRLEKTKNGHNTCILGRHEVNRDVKDLDYNYFIKATFF